MKICKVERRDGTKAIELTDCYSLRSDFFEFEVNSKLFLILD